MIQHLYIQDLKSLHGTYVNNELLPSCTKLPLNHNDIVQLGISFRSDKGMLAYRTEQALLTDSSQAGLTQYECVSSSTTKRRD